MDPRKLRLGFLVAAAAMALAFVLPPAPRALPLLARPYVWEISAAACLSCLLAAWLPYWRLKRIDPASVLRS